MNSRRIALIASSRHPVRQPFAGGLEAHVWHLGRALTLLGHDVTLFAAAGSDVTVRRSAFDIRPFHPSPSATTDPSMPSDRFLADHHAYLSLMLELSSAPTSFDVVHNHSLHHLPVAMAPALGIPMLTTLHTPPTPWLESALKISRGRGSRFAAVSRHTADSWRHVVEDITVVANGVDLDRWPPGPGGPDVVWFGRITPEKGTHLAIAAAHRAHRRLHLAGPVSDRQYFDTDIAPVLGDSVVYHGHLDHAALAHLVGHCAAALVTPTWDEPYGLVVAEALACGTPVIAFERGGIPEVLDSTVGRLIAPNDVAAMASALGEIETFSRTAARHRARTTCSEFAMVSRYLALYGDMMHEAAHHRSTTAEESRSA